MNEELKSIIDGYISQGFGSSKISNILRVRHGVSNIGHEQLTYIVDEYLPAKLEEMAD